MGGTRSISAAPLERLGNKGCKGTANYEAAKIFGRLCEISMLPKNKSNFIEL
jgi:hypothetical protein